MLALLFGILVLVYDSPVFSFIFPGFDLFMAIIGVVMFGVGIAIIFRSIREGRRVYQAVKGRDGVNLDAISSEARVPYERTKDYIHQWVASGILRGKIEDDTFVALANGKLLDSRTVRCPYCDKEFDLHQDR
jgi:hypothetical protein